MKKSLILISNFFIVLLTILEVSFYVRNKNIQYSDNNIQDFMTMTASMAQVTTNYLETEQQICDIWASYINAQGLSIYEAIDFLTKSQTNIKNSAHILIEKDGIYKGLSNRAKTNDKNSFEVSYQGIDIFDSDSIFDKSKAIRVTRSYTNPMNGIQSIAFCDTIYLNEPVTSKDNTDQVLQKALLLRVIPVETLAKKWVFPTDEYNNAEISMIDLNGNYIIKGNAFKNSNFFEFFKSYNDYTQLSLAVLQSSVHTQGKIEMKNSHKEDCLASHIPIKSAEDWTLIALIPIKDIKDNNIDWVIVGLVALGLLLLLLMDLILFNIFNRQLSNAAKEAYQANQAKTNFLSTMSHDIRTPMNAIIGLITIAEKNVMDSKLVQESLKKIRLASNHLLTLINDILDISKIESGKISLSPVVFSIADTAENLVNISLLTVNQKNIDFRFRCKDIKYEYLYADQLRINQIFINVLSNALKYTQDSKSVYVDLIEEGSEKEGFVKLTYKVSDTGMGMSEDFMKKMYQPFSRQTDSRINTIQGTGLGLAITKKMVDLMGGSIECQSKLGEGTTFTVCLELKKSDREENFKLPPLNILVIDDDPVLLETAADTLTDLGTKVETSIKAKQALEKIAQKNKESENSYDLIILDWKMPDLSGLELTAKIREIEGKEIPILLVSSYDWSIIEQEAIKAGINGFISKPLFRSSLYKKISEILGFEKEKTSQEENTQDIEGMNVLIAEDMDVNWEIISSLLDMYKINSKRAENGKVAVDILKNLNSKEFDVVFMDIQMPIMNGLEATRKIRKLSNPYAKDIPIIAMTADAFSEDIAESFNAGMNGHISKPIDIKHVIKELKKIKSTKKGVLNE